MTLTCIYDFVLEDKREEKVLHNDDILIGQKVLNKYSDELIMK